MKSSHDDRFNSRGPSGRQSKAVFKLKDGVILGKYHSESDAMRKTGVDRRSISKCCLGKKQTAGGFNWEFQQKNPKEETRINI